MVKIDYFQGIPLFAKFTQKQLKALAQIAKRETYKKGKLIFKEEQKGDSLFVIIKGKVAIEKEPLLKGTKPIATLTCEDGDFFGELSLFAGLTRSSTARTTENTEFIVFNKDNFLKLLKAKPVVAAQLFLTLIKVIGLRIKQTNKELITFYETGRLMGLTHQLEQLLKNLLQISTQASAARCGVIFMQNFTTGFWEPAALKGYAQRKIKPINPSQQQGIINRVLAKGQPLLIKDLSKSDLGRLPRQGYEHTTMILVPLGRRENIKGIVVLADKRIDGKGNEFTENDLNLLTAVARQVSATLENIELHKQEENRDKIKREYFSF